MLFRKFKISDIIVLILMLSITVMGQGKGKITGKILDGETNQPLPGANIILMGTALGSSTDMYGKFLIKQIPAGKYKLKISFVGYDEKLLDVEVKSNSTLTINESLSIKSLEGEEVVVTAQAIGQKAAINMQLSAKKIMNVVSSARIQELPDANAAESVGRLPGISILRDGGEGNKLVVRGLQPKYNAIMVNGVRLSSSNPDDRSIDLSMISPYMLDGIEVSKNVTPDQDADVLGGTVNFKIKTAGGTTEKKDMRINILSQGGYNGLDNAYNKYNNYKYVGSLEKRFFNGKVGFFGQVDVERKNLTSNELGIGYNQLRNSQTDYKVDNINLHYIPRDKQTLNSTVVGDYKFDGGNITLTNFFSSGKTKVQDRNEIIDINYNSHDYWFNYSERKLTMLTNALTFEKEFNKFKLEARFAHFYTKTENPNNWQIDFRQNSALNNVSNFVNKANIDPRDVNKDVNNNLNETFLSNVITGSSNFEDRAYSTGFDITYPFLLTNNINSEIKFGGKYRHQKREFSREQYDGQGLSLASARFVDDLITKGFSETSQYIGSTTIPITAFIDNNYDYGNFLDGQYSLSAPLSFGMMDRIANILKSNQQYIKDNNAEIAYGKNNFQSTSYNYNGTENQFAAYAMATLNFGDDLEIITGARLQSLKTEYTGARGIQSPISYYSYTHYDTTVTKTHTYLLPAFILRYKPLKWFDVRFAYTNTLAYPDFNAIIPRIDVGNGSIAWNNFDLKPSQSMNFDLYFSFHENKLGLFTIGGFYKQIKDLIYADYFYVSKDKALKYFPPSLVSDAGKPKFTYRVDTYVNNPYEVDLYGLEADWQTNFWYLPGVLSGLVFNANYTHTYSEAEYPYTAKKGGWVTTYVDTSFKDRLLYQPNDILNLSLGLDYKDFSIRVSMLYQADIFAGVNFWEQLRTTTDAYTRWDLSVKQKLPWYNIQLFGILNNINGEKDVNVLQKYNERPQTIQDYGMTAIFGIRWEY